MNKEDPFHTLTPELKEYEEKKFEICCDLGIITQDEKVRFLFELNKRPVIKTAKAVKLPEFKKES